MFCMGGIVSACMVEHTLGDSRVRCKGKSKHASKRELRALLPKVFEGGTGVEEGEDLGVGIALLGEVLRAPLRHANAVAVTVAVVEDDVVALHADIAVARVRLGGTAERVAHECEPEFLGTDGGGMAGGVGEGEFYRAVGLGVAS